LGAYLSLMDPEVELMGSRSVRLSVRVSWHLAGRLDESAGDAMRFGPRAKTFSIPLPRKPSTGILKSTSRSPRAVYASVCSAIRITVLRS